MAIYYSAQTGNWSSASTWLSSASLGSAITVAVAPPQSFGGDKIIVRANHTVTYDVSGCFGDETSTYTAGTPNFNIHNNAIILSGGTLKASRTLNTELTARGTVYIAPSGTLDWGSTADPLSTINANITLHYMSQLSALSASQGAAGIYLHGSSVDNQAFYNNIYINGKPRLRSTVMTASAASGATVISVASAVGWQVGDRLVVATESIANVSSSTVGVLSSTIIQSITGSNMTISPGLNTSRSAGTCVGNFTSNIVVKSYNPAYASFGIFTNSGMVNTIDIGNIKVESVGNGVTTPVGWTFYATAGARATVAQTGNSIGAITLYNTLSQVPSYTLKSVAMESPVGTPAHYGIQVNGKLSETIVVEDCVAYNTNITSYLSQSNAQASTYYKNCSLFRSVYGILMGGSVANAMVIDNCNLDATSPLANSINSLTLNVFNSKLRALSYISPLDAIQYGTIKNSRIYHNSSTGAILQNNVNASGEINFSNCTFYFGTTPLSAVTKTAIGTGNKTAQTAKFTVFQANDNQYDYRRFNYYHYSQADLITRKRGITSFRIKPDIANTEFYNYFTVPATINTPQRIKGSLRFDSNYGTSNPPSISFVGAGVNVLCACPAVANTWFDFDVTLNPTTTDDIISTITCKSSGTNGYAWVDGVPFYPYIQTVRHYGFEFNNNIYRTVNDHNTLSSEAAVAALTSISTLDYLYDSATYWSVTNPASSYYIDVVNFDGTVLDFNDKNIVVDGSSVSTFNYNATTNTITIKSSTLSGGSKFDTIMSLGSLSTVNETQITSNVLIRTSNLDSELVYNGADNIVLYPSLSDAQSSINPGPSANNGVLRFLYGQTLQGVTLSGTTYIKWTAGSYSDLYTGTISQGRNELGDLSNQAGLAIAINNMNIINQGVQKASLIVPHAASTATPTGLTVQIQTLIDDQQIVNEGVKKASRLIPHTTNL